MALPCQIRVLELHTEHMLVMFTASDKLIGYVYELEAINVIIVDMRQHEVVQALLQHRGAEVRLDCPMLLNAHSLDALLAGMMSISLIRTAN